MARGWTVGFEVTAYLNGFRTGTSITGIKTRTSADRRCALANKKRGNIFLVYKVERVIALPDGTTTHRQL